MKILLKKKIWMDPIYKTHKSILSKNLSLKLVYSNVHIFKKLFCYVISDSQPNSRTIEKLAYG